MAKKKTATVDGANNVPSTPPTNTLGYTGNVTLKLKKGQKIIKTYNINNNGTLRLFRGIAYYLTSNKLSSTQEYLPNFMAAGKADNLNPPSVNDIRLQCQDTAQFVRAKAQNIEILETSCVAPFSGVFSGAADMEVNEIGLFSAMETNSLLARIVLKEAIKIEIGMNLIVEWRIAIQNTAS